MEWNLKEEEIWKNDAVEIANDANDQNLSKLELLCSNFNLNGQK